MRLAPCGQLAEVVAATFGNHGAAFAPQGDGCHGRLGLGEKIVGEGQSGAEQFTAPGGAVLWEFRGGQDEIGFGKQVFLGLRVLSAVTCFQDKAGISEKQPLAVFLQRTFQTLPHGNDCRDAPHLTTVRQASLQRSFSRCGPDQKGLVRRGTFLVLEGISSLRTLPSLAIFQRYIAA